VETLGQLHYRFILFAVFTICLKGMCRNFDKMFSAIPQQNKRKFISFQSVPFEKMFPTIPQRNNGSFIRFRSVPIEKMFSAILLSRNSAAEQRNSIRFQLLPLEKMFPAISLSRTSATEQRKFSFLMGNTCPFFHCPVFRISVAPGFLFS